MHTVTASEGAGDSLFRSDCAVEEIDPYEEQERRDKDKRWMAIIYKNGKQTTLPLKGNKITNTMAKVYIAKSERDAIRTLEAWAKEKVC